MIGTVVGRYLVERALTGGGMSRVFVGRTVDASGGFPEGLPVVLKVMSEELSKEETARKRFLKEAQILSRLRHKNITRFYEFIPRKNGPILVMEYVQGEAVDRIASREKQLDIGKAIDIVRNLLAALVYAHDKKIVHRDIKPANLILKPDGVVKVTDFGIAKIREAAAPGQTVLTKSGLLLGTPYYMSPEQIREPKDAGSQSDIYSTGVVLYELLTGSLPFASGSLRKLIEAVYRGKKTPPSALRPELDPDLDAIVMKSIERETADRYVTAQEFLDALTEYAAVPAEVRREAAMRSRTDPTVRQHANWRLVSSQGSENHAISGADAMVGRDRGCTIVVSHPAVSRRHARITLAGGMVMLEDLKSSNGTFVNDLRIERTTLKAGDVVRFGVDPKCSFVLHDH